MLDRSKRKGLDALLKSVEAGEVDAVVTLWTSRLSREERDRAQILDVLDVYDVEWHALADGGRIDRSTYAGYVTYGVHTIFDVAFSKRVGENWRNAHARRLEAGLPKTTSPRFGYRYERGRGYVVHEGEGEVVRDLYHRYTRGDGFTPLVRWLNAEGWVVTRTGNPWSVRTLSRFLDSGFAAGFISREAHLRDKHIGTHEPLISADEWQAYLGRREKQAVLGRKASGAGERWWLAGIVRCGLCGGPTYVDSFKRPDGRSSALCVNRRSNPDVCDGTAILRAYVEGAVGLWLGPHLDQLDALANSEQQTVVDAAAVVFQDAVAARDKIADGLASLEVKDALGDIQPAVYRRAKDTLTAQLTDAEKVVKQTASELHKPEADTAKVRHGVERGWTADERAALRGVLDRVEVHKDHISIIPTTGAPTTRTRAELAPRCRVAGCDRQHYTKGLCRSHAMTARNMGVFDALAERVNDDVLPSVTMDEVATVFDAARISLTA